MVGWDKAIVREVCEAVNVGHVGSSTPHRDPNGVPFLMGKNIGPGFLKLEKLERVNQAFHTKQRKSQLRENDVVVVRIGQSGQASKIPDDLGSANCSGLVIIKQPDLSRIDVDFLVYYLNSPEGRANSRAQARGSTRITLNTKSVASSPIPLPPLPEQERIVAILDEAFTAIETATANAEKNIENARELFESHSSQLFTRLIETLGVKTLDEVCENLDKQRVPITKAKRIAGSIPYYGASGVVDHVESALFDEDLLLVSEDGANLLARTYPIAFSVSGPSWVNNHAHVLRFKSMHYQKYVEYYLNSISLEPFISGMAQPKLNQGKLNSIPIPWPNDDQQASEVVESLIGIANESDALSSITKARLIQLNNLKQSLLHRAFTGELITDKNAADKTLSEAGV